MCLPLLIILLCSPLFAPFPCLHPFIIFNHLWFMSVHHSCPLLPAGYVHLLVVQSVGHMYLCECPFVCPDACCCSCLLSMPIPTYGLCTLSVISVHAQLPCSCVSSPPVVSCNTLYYLLHIISIKPLNVSHTFMSVHFHLALVMSREIQIVSSHNIWQLKWMCSEQIALLAVISKHVTM